MIKNNIVTPMLQVLDIVIAINSVFKYIGEIAQYDGHSFL